MTESISSTFYNITVEVGIYRKKFPEMRYGQAVYNIAYEHFPNVVVDNLTATNFDCYYDDSKVVSFLNKLQEMLDEKLD